GSPSSNALVVLFLLVVALFVSVLFLIFRELRSRKRSALAYDCALVVGQELNLLMRQGCGVFHDFPGDGFVVDHVLVGPSGVYAVTTEGREKPEKRHGDIEDRVFYDGKVLSFPGWSEAGPVNRTRQQVAWLADWLKGVVGEPVNVKGVIFLPGWIIETNGRHEISVVTEKNAAFLGRPRGKNILSVESVQRVSYQIEQRCRNMSGGATA
ncbi:MAG: NERD domain-containing protein, partial [Desulfobulbaceae bacterium]|nr:NERD domain-containing protein [Desulfobulbaceae bacterium]